MDYLARKMSNKTLETQLEVNIKSDDFVYFLHIPKTAGTSLTNIIENNFNFDQIYPKRIWPELFENL